MASRTYLPTLVRILHKACVYIVRYRAVLLVNLPANGAALLDAIVIACEAFIAVAEHEIGE